MTVALYPGRFDPVTNGHVDIVQRAAHIFESVVVGVAVSRSAIFTLEERMQMFERAVAEIGLRNVKVTSIEGLTVEEAKKQGASVLVRGLRVADFTYELDQALMNRSMAPDIESVYMMTSIEHLFVSATRVRELASFGRDVSEFVPPGVNEAIQEKMAARTS
jgi:pantetheine-phosphate adenylyltransferase